MVFNEELCIVTEVLVTSHCTGLVTTLCLRTYRRRLENVYTPVPIKLKSIMILYLVMVKLSFSLCTKKGKECSCNTERYVFVGELLIRNLERAPCLSCGTAFYVTMLQRIVFLHWRLQTVCHRRLN